MTESLITMSIAPSIADTPIVLSVAGVQPARKY